MKHSTSKAILRKVLERPGMDLLLHKRTRSVIERRQEPFEKPNHKQPFKRNLMHIKAKKVYKRNGTKVKVMEIWRATVH